MTALASSVTIVARHIVDWPSFHAEFDRLLSFPDFYGKNMDAWIDCMTSLDRPEDGLTGIHVGKGQVLKIEIDDVDDLKKRCPEQYAALIECSAFVNWRRNEAGESSVIALSFRAGET